MVAPELDVPEMLLWPPLWVPVPNTPLPARRLLYTAPDPGPVCRGPWEGVGRQRGLPGQQPRTAGRPPAVDLALNLFTAEQVRGVT